jgi:phage terminase small subunit
MTKALAHKEDLGKDGPAVRALPNQRWRDFVYHYVTQRPGHGALTNAARLAGFGKDSTAATLSKIAWQLSHDERMIAAIAEVSRAIVRRGAPEAVNALLEMVRNAEHRDHARAVNMVLARTDPEVSRHDISVTHKVIDEDEEAREELRALRALGTPREKLIELFGVNGLARIEAQEATDKLRRSNEAKVIDGEVIQDGR